MIVSLIVAMDEAGGIGFRGRLPWHLGTDLRLFRERTLGHHLVVGRRTWEAIGRPLPGRKMIVISRTLSAVPEGVQVARSLAEALDWARGEGEEEVFIGGGAQVYTVALPLARRIYLTRVQARGEADTFFPAVNWAQWRCVERQAFPAGPQDDHPFEAEIWVRP